MLLDINGVRILTDPGTFTTQQDNTTNVDMLLITHEHGDHYHLDSIKKIVANNPSITIITNSAVGKLLDEAGIKHQIVGNGQNATIKNITISGHGTKHAIIYGELGQVENTGFLLDNKFYFPGDAFTTPGKPVDVLAVPMAGPWMKIAEAIDFAKEIMPKKAFAVHDGMIISTFNFASFVAKTIFEPMGIEFVAIELNKETEF